MNWLGQIEGGALCTQTPSSHICLWAQLEVDEVFLNFDSFEAECTGGSHLTEEERKILTAQKTVKKREYNHWKWADATVGVTDFQRTLAAVWNRINKTVQKPAIYDKAGYDMKEWKPGQLIYLNHDHKKQNKKH